MYFVIIDLRQLYTRLANTLNLDLSEFRIDAHLPVDVDAWLHRHRFVPADNGYLATADAMNRLSCSEILYSERRLMPLPRREPAYQTAVG